MAFIQTFRELQVYQLARISTQKIFWITRSFPFEENIAYLIRLDDPQEQ